MGEFNPYNEFLRLARHWWVIGIFMLAGGGLAFLFHQLQPPVYEAKATLLATIDLERFPLHDTRADLIQYNEDIALGNVEGALRSAAVTQALLASLKDQGLSLDAAALLKSSTIERRNAIWEVRFRSADPRTAQTIVNQWVEIGYQAMLEWQSTERIPAYVILEPPTPAVLPAAPVAYGRSNLLLAGSLAGLILGVLFDALIPSRKTHLDNPAHA